MKRRTVSFSTISIHQPDLAERVANTIRQLIFEQKLKPGDHIREVQLSRDLNVSRTPLREALRYLERDGLLVRKPFRGVFVASMTQEEMPKVFRIRTVLESMAFADARRRIRTEDWAVLRNYIDAMKAAAKRHDLSEFNRNDTAFHQYIWTLAGDEVLGRVLNYLLRRHLVVYNIQTLVLLNRNELTRMLATHEEMLDLLKDDRKDPHACLAAMQDRALKQMTLKLFRSRAPR